MLSLNGFEKRSNTSDMLGVVFEELCVVAAISKEGE
jgi:hypothetical protein